MTFCVDKFTHIYRIEISDIPKITSLQIEFLI